MSEQRRRAIADILRESPVCTQEELVTALSDKGFSVTQATVSRDMREMSLVKIPDDEGGYRYALSDDKRSLSKEEHIISEFVAQVDGSGNLAVIRTMAGAAQGVAAALDKLGWPEAMGSLAGDDTIFVALRSPRDLKPLLGRLNKLLKET